MQLSVREAALRVGVTRQTIFKKIKDGELSATVDHRGNKQVDVTELLRVYGQLQSNDSKQSMTVNKVRQSKQSYQNTDLQLELERSKMLLQMKDRELQIAQERIDDLRTREAESKSRERDALEEKLRLLSVIESQTRLLTAPVSVKTSTRPKTVPEKPKTKALTKAGTSSRHPSKITAKKVVTKTPPRSVKPSVALTKKTP